MIPEKVPITYPIEDVTLIFFVIGDPLYYHSIDSCFIVIDIFCIHVLCVLYFGLPKRYPFFIRVAPVGNWRYNTQLPGYNEIRPS